MSNAFEKNILSIYGDRGKAWLHNLPETVQRLLEQWHLSDLKPMDNLTYNYVLSGQRNGMPVILKLNPDAASLDREAKALKAFEGHGAVKLLEVQKNALLLQQAIPGRTLKGHPKAIEIACSLVKTLHKAPIPTDHPFPNMQNWLADLDKDWNIAHHFLKKAREWKQQLLQDTPVVLLHGDLHQDNILSHGDQWLVIDPKGVIGTAIHEVWACVENLKYDLPFIAQFFNYPIERVLQCYFVHLILAACWQLEDNLDPSRFLSLAESIF